MSETPAITKGELEALEDLIHDVRQLSLTFRFLFEKTFPYKGSDASILGMPAPPTDFKHFVANIDQVDTVNFIRDKLETAIFHLKVTYDTIMEDDAAAA